jgi:hypothetical protein
VHSVQQSSTSLSFPSPTRHRPRLPIPLEEPFSEYRWQESRRREHILTCQMHDLQEACRQTVEFGLGLLFHPFMLVQFVIGRIPISNSKRFSMKGSLAHSYPFDLSMNRTPSGIPSVFPKATLIGPNALSIRSKTWPLPHFPVRGR